MKIILRILLLSVIFCSTLQSTNLWAKDNYNNKILNLYGINLVVIDSLDNEDGFLNPYVIIDILESIPTPLEVSLLVKDLGSEYHKTQLSLSENADNYTNDYTKALNLGIYSVDFGYANLYQENEDAINYLNTIKKLTDGLNIGQFLDYVAIQKLAQASNDLDSLLQLTSQKFEHTTTELANQKREHLSLLILTGGWLESLYITSLVYKDSHNEELKNKIGEQKLVLDRILLALNIYPDKPHFKPLIDELENIRKIYENVEVIEKSGNPRMEVLNGEIVITDTKETIVTISDKDTESIINLITSIRNKIVSH